MNYVAIELKTKKDGTFEVSTFKKTDKYEAERAFHSILSGAATSENPVHAAIVLNEYGQVVKQPEYYKHEDEQPAE